MQDLPDPTTWDQNEDYRSQEDSPIRKKVIDTFDHTNQRLHAGLAFTSTGAIIKTMVADTVALSGLVGGMYLFHYYFPTVYYYTIRFVIAMIFFAFHIPIIQKTSVKLETKWFGLQWKVTYAVEIKAATSFDSFVTLLENMRFLRFYQLNKIDTEQTVLVVTGRRWLLPLDITPAKFVKLIDNILQAEQIVYERVEIPDIRLQRFHFLTSPKLYLHLDQLIRQLVDNELGGELLVMTQFNHQQVVEEELKVGTYFDIYIGFSAHDLDAWMGLINAISSGVRHRLYGFYLLNRYTPKIWRVLSKITRIPLLSWFVEGRSRNIVFGRKLRQGFRFPRYDRLAESIFTYTPPSFKNSYHYQLGSVIAHGVTIDDFGIPLTDLAQGGIIAGAIGTGKTTLRLHIMRLCRGHGLRVIDFDLKGDATRYAKLIDGGKVIIPGRNFQLNPFLLPKGFTEREYANILFQSFVETIPKGSELSPAQLHLLTRAIGKTIKDKGNAYQFFKNLYILASEEQQFIDNKQDTTAQAIITRFNWMQTVMHDIFWHDGSSLLITDYQRTSLFFDLSELDVMATKQQIRFLINLVMARITAAMRYRRESELRDVIFLDETQLLMPRKGDNTELSKLEQTVTTLRYKGVSVIATGVSAAMMSPVLLDVGFVAQFRSESEALFRALALEDDKKSIIPQLPPFHTMIRAPSLGSQPVMVKTREFEGELTIPPLKKSQNKALDSFSMQNQASSPSSKEKSTPREIGNANINNNRSRITRNDAMTRHISESVPLADFELDFDTIWASRFESIIFDMKRPNPYIFRELQAVAAKYITNTVKTFDLAVAMIQSTITKSIEYAKQQVEAKSLDPVVTNYLNIYLRCVLYHYMMNLARELRYSPQHNLLLRNYKTITHDVLTTGLEITKSKKPVVANSHLTTLRQLMKQIRTHQHLDKMAFNATIVEIAAKIENFARKVGSDGLGLAINIADITAQGWLEPKEHDILNNFRKLRNRIIHGTHTYSTGNTESLGLILTGGEIVLRIWEEYYDMVESGKTQFWVDDDEENEDNNDEDDEKSGENDAIDDHNE